MFSKEAGQNIWYDIQKVSRVAKGSTLTQQRVKQTHV
jgi:membrane peptidoglycan carboxypeptidase